MSIRFPAVPFVARATGLAVLALAAAAIAGPARADATPCTPFGPVVPGAPLPGSCFEGNDGDQVDSDGTGAGNDRLDWQTVISANITDFTSGNNDSQFGPGGSEETPDSWTFDFGSLGSDKYDVVSAWSATEEDTDDLFLALAFVRASNNGTTHLAFELNAKTPGYRTAIEDGSGREIKVPTRSPGDLLITYSVDPPVLGFCKWAGNEHTGQWLDFNGNAAAGSNCPPLPPDLVQASMNQTDIPAAENFLEGGANALDAKTFAEASINLTEAVKILSGGGPDPCVNFGYMWVHSRSSVSITSNQQDYILPDTAANIANCAVSGVKWHDVNGNGLRDGTDDGLGGWTIFADYDDDGVLDADEPFDISAPRDANDLRAPGSYTVAGIKDGTWKIREVGQAGWFCTTPAPCSHEVTMTGEEIPGKDFGNFQPAPGINVEKTPSVTTAHVGDTVTYTFEVTNTGNVPLDVDISDPKCDPGTLVGPTGDADADSLLDLTETWVYSCTHVVDNADGDPLHNQVDVLGTDPFGNTVPDDDTADVDVLHPSLDLDKKVRNGNAGPFVDGPVEAHVGDTLEYEITVDNTGDTELTVVLDDPRCDAGTLAGPTGDADADGKLDVTETWVYTCSHVLTALDPQPFDNVATATGTDPLGGTDDDTDNAVAQPLVPGIQVVKKAGVAQAHVGDTVTYTFTVTNTGNVPLTVVLDDPKCDAGTVAGPDGDTNADTKLDLAETWVYTCTHVVVSGDGDPLHNVVTVTGTDHSGGSASDTDDEDVDVVHPAVAIDKTGPATAEAGQLVTYTLTVTNPGDIALVGETLAVTDPKCQAPPLLQGKFTGAGTTADASPATLDPGDRWVYTCSVQTAAGETSIVNVGNVCGVDVVGGDQVCDNDDATTQLSQPPQPAVVTPPALEVKPDVVVSGAAKLAGPAACVRKAFKVRITGRQIAKVVFTIDGKTVKTFRNASGTGRRFVLNVNPSKYATGVHRLKAKVTYSAASQTSGRTLQMVFERCRRQAIKPAFTG